MPASGETGGLGAIKPLAFDRTYFLGATIALASGAHVTFRHSGIRHAYLPRHRHFARTVRHGVDRGGRLGHVRTGAGHHRGRCRANREHGCNS